jgi:hypothetical protein
MSTSLTLNLVSAVEMRMSHDRLMSKARPKEIPCRTQMTGFSHFSREVMQFWN